MRKSTILIATVLAVQLLGAIALSQVLELEEAKLLQPRVPIKSDSGRVIGTTTVHVIRCRLFIATVADSGRITDSSNWKVLADGRAVAIEGVRWSEADSLTVRLIGPFEGYDRLTVSLLGGKPVLVDISEAAVGSRKWGFGKGTVIDLNLRRLAEQKALFAFDYDFNVSMVEHYLSAGGGDLWFRSLSLNVTSEGTIGSDDEVRNGSESSLGIAAHPYYFVGGLIYGAELFVSYQVETQMNAGEDELFDVINERLKFGVEGEIPYTNVPMYKLHTVTGYTRLAMPLTLSLQYLPQAGDGDTYNDLARFDIKARYELALSPYLILQAEWRYSRFLDVPPVLDQSVSYHSLTFAQDLDVVKSKLGFLALMLGRGEEIQGQHFVFYRISSGRRGPAFEDIEEQSFGFGTYF